MEKVKDAFKIKTGDGDYKFGEAFDFDLQEKKREEK